MLIPSISVIVIKHARCLDLSNTIVVIFNGGKFEPWTNILSAIQCYKMR